MANGRYIGRISTTLFCAAALISGCDGDDDGGSPGPGDNQPPAFTSAATLNVQEGAAGTVYTATATDPDGDTLSFSLAGGADRARFAITTGGALSFVAPPDFEVPGDADGNNVYLVQIAVSDGRTSTTLDLSITVQDAGPDALRVSRVGTGFSQPLALVGVPDNSGRVFVVERAGRIRILNPASGATTTFLDIVSQTTTDGERGLLGMALAPDFTTSGAFYLYLTNTAGNIEVRRYRTVTGNRDQGDPASGDVLLVIAHPGASNHNGGFIEFGPDGLLYLGTGDGGGANDPNDNAQNRGSLLGKILRIDIAGDGFPGDPLRDYRIPAGNPFAGGGGAAEVWAYGLRNPFRAGFDPLTQNLWIGDVGQGAREEVDLMRPTDGGANFGWDVVEGTLGTPQAGFVPPVAEYGHGSGPTQGNSITGGRVYRGPIEALRGQYIFGDFISGNLWSFPIAQAAIGQTLQGAQFTLRNTDFAPNAGTIDNPACFGVDQAGNLYIVDLDGEIFRIEPA
jgi:glucose/arabinose dehydrogenase